MSECWRGIWSEKGWEPLYYRNQTMQVKWGTFVSDAFTVNNGVTLRISPYLFTEYLDELSVRLGTARTGCTVGIRLWMNYCLVMIYVYWPPASAVFNAVCHLNICFYDAPEHKMFFNCNKTVSVVLSPRATSAVFFPNSLVLNSLSKSNMLMFYSMHHWNMTVTLTVRWNHFIVQQTSSASTLPSALLHVKHDVSCILYGNVCLPVVVQVSKVLLISALCMKYPFRRNINVRSPQLSYSRHLMPWLESLFLSCPTEAFNKGVF